MKKIRFNPRPTKEESDVVEAECRKMFDLKPVQVVKKPKRKPYTLHWVTTDPYRCYVIAVMGDLMAARKELDREFAATMERGLKIDISPIRRRDENGEKLP